MRPYLISLIAFISLSLNVYAQKAGNNSNSLLWKISKADMKKPSFLFGTIHVICKDDYLWTPAMKSSLKNAETICMELDMDDPSLMLEVATGMMNTSGKTLKDYFSESDYQKLSKYISDSLKMSISLFEQMKPAALISLFATTNNNGCNNPQSYETNIAAEAQNEKKEVLGLESVSEQLDLFDNLPVDSVVKEVMNVVNGVKTDEVDYHKLIAAYKKQDLPTLYKFIKASGEFDQDLAGFLDVRNEKWIPRMITMMDKQSVFFAVGAGHLWGDNGVISLLRKAGYTVTAIK